MDGALNTASVGVVLAATLSNILGKGWWKQLQRRGASDLHEPGRRLVIVGTASVPWMTGTAVNPTLRAAYAAHCTDLEVTLLAPWIPVEDQKLLFPNNRSFQDPEQQAECIREWIAKRTGLNPDFNIVFWPGRYDRTMLGIFPVGDLTAIARPHGDVVVLEEPEHLTWFHHGPRWTDVFPHVVGVMHTNYRELGRRNAGLVVSGVSTLMNYLVCAIHCHKVIKLSGAVQTLPRQVTECVHGAAPHFLAVGDEVARAGKEGRRRFSKGAYCLAKVVWGKGWEELLDLLAKHEAVESAAGAAASDATAGVDGYGDGEALATIRARAEELKLHLHFHPKRDHLDPSLRDYQVFINASTSDVVATTSMEALAMGKWLICARHPCNAFLSTFTNCLVYESPSQFSEHLRHALREEPAVMSPDERRRLSWEAATERFLDAASISAGDWPSRASYAQESMLWALYNTVTGIEPVRQAICAGPNTIHAPPEVTAYDPRGGTARRQGLQGVLSHARLWVSLNCPQLSVGLGEARLGLDRWADGPGERAWA